MYDEIISFERTALEGFRVARFSHGTGEVVIRPYAGYFHVRNPDGHEYTVLAECLDGHPVPLFGRAENDWLFIVPPDESDALIRQQARWYRKEVAIPRSTKRMRPCWVCASLSKESERGTHT